MRLVCIFTDREEMLNHRKVHSQDHLDYLAKHRAEIVLAGGLRDQQGGVYTGGLWVLEVDSFARAKELVENDPYYVPEYRSYSLKVWGKAFQEPVVL